MLDHTIYSFFFQAEDGIRDKLVTGVQTCALPIYVAGLDADWTNASVIDEQVELIRARVGQKKVICALSGGVDSSVAAALRSEERRVGKECRSRWSPDH